MTHLNYNDHGDCVTVNLRVVTARYCATSIFLLRENIESEVGWEPIEAEHTIPSHKAGCAPRVCAYVCMRRVRSAKFDSQITLRATLRTNTIRYVGN